MAQTGTTCPACSTPRARVFYRVDAIPLNSVLQLDTREEALEFPTGEMALGHCAHCGFIYNTAFDAARLEYSSRYEETQSCSAVFRRWHEGLVRDLVDRYDLHGKRIIEIGCGKGEFLRMLCEVGDNRGLGFDPSYVAGRDGGGQAEVEFIADFYGPQYAHHRGDFVCCKMTLEHIADVGGFVDTVRETVGDRRDTVVLFQIPDVERILEDRGFWDVYYEHCSYFSLGSLGRLFRRAGFDVQRLTRDYGGQYIMIEARPANGTPSPPLAEEDDLERIASLVRSFQNEMRSQLRGWSDRLARYKRDQRRVVVWSSSSKATAFLTTLPHTDLVEWVVDINPRRQGHFMAKGGQQICGPDALVSYRPDVVIAMNPIYESEIKADLSMRGLEPEVLTT